MASDLYITDANYILEMMVNFLQNVFTIEILYLIHIGKIQGMLCENYWWFTYIISALWYYVIMIGEKIAWSK